MTTASVYHAIKPSFGISAIPFNKANYTLVALVDVPPDYSEHNWAYQVTNHIDQPWWENEGVTLIVEPKQRSTSVGDVVVRSDGKILLCVTCGWEEIEVRNFKTAPEIFGDSDQLRTEDFIFLFDPAFDVPEGAEPHLVYAHLLIEGGFGMRIGSFCITAKGDIDCLTIDAEWVDDGINALDKAIAQFSLCRIYETLVIPQEG
jgi:hypothetical protein